jgi:hypothetical protein
MLGVSKCVQFAQYGQCCKIKKNGLIGMYCRRTHWVEGKCPMYLVEKPQRKRSFGTRRLGKNIEGYHPFGTRVNLEVKPGY